MKLKFLFMLLMVSLFYACTEEEVLPEQQPEAEGAVYWGDYTPPAELPSYEPITSGGGEEAQDNVYDVTLSSNGTSLTGVLTLDLGKYFGSRYIKNYFNDATLEIDGQTFNLVRRNVAIANGYGSFLLFFENEAGEKFDVDAEGVLGSTLTGTFTSDAQNLPSGGSFSAVS